MKKLVTALLRLRDGVRGKQSHSKPGSGLPLEAVRGKIDQPKRGGVLAGWALAKNPAENPVLLNIEGDGVPIGQVKAKLFRQDLADKGIGDGNSGFEFGLPAQFLNTESHTFSISDARTGQAIDTRKITLAARSNYTGFDSFIPWAFHNRMVYAPFSEVDKRCLAFMDWHADHLQTEMNRFPGELPLVSVILAIHQAPRDLPKAIQSVLDQGYSRWELLVVDGGNSGVTAEICSRFADPRIHFLPSPQTQGSAEARNEGLKNATGKFIAYLEPDGWWDPRFLSAMVPSMLQNGADFAYCGQYLYRGDDSQKPFGVQTGPFNPGLLGNRNYIGLSAMIHSRALLDKVGLFDPELKQLADWDLAIRLADEEWPFFVPVNLASGASAPCGLNEDLELAQGQIRAKRNIWPHALPAEFLETISPGEQPAKFHALPPASRVAPRSKRGVSVIIPSYNIPEILEQCVAAVFEHGGVENVELILCDNASDPETQELMDALKQRYGRVKIERFDCNFGFTYSVNRGIELAEPGNDVVLLNNDAIGTDGWLAALCEAAEAHEEAGMIAPQQVLLPFTRTIQDHAPFASTAMEIEVNVSHHHANFIATASRTERLIEVNFIPFFCVLIKRSVLDSVGPLDVVRGRHYRSDRIYCDVVRQVAGKKIYVAFRSKVYHLLQQSTVLLKKSQAETYKALFVKNDWSDLKSAATEPWN